MGQPISELDRTTVGDVAIFTLDRNLMSMGTMAYDAAPESGDDDDFSAELAGRVFRADTGINRVYLAGNVVQVTRHRGWDDETLDVVGALIADLFRFYD